MNSTSVKLSIDGTILNPYDIAVPCGLVAKSFFQDSYVLYSLNNTQRIGINESNIASANDIKYMFKNFPNYKSVQWLNIENEHFMVWMNMMPFSNFRKRWGKIDQTLEIGLYNLTINNGIL